MELALQRKKKAGPQRAVSEGQGARTEKTESKKGGPRRHSRNPDLNGAETESFPRPKWKKAEKRNSPERPFANERNRRKRKFTAGHREQKKNRSNIQRTTTHHREEKGAIVGPYPPSRHWSGPCPGMKRCHQGMRNPSRANSS